MAGIVPSAFLFSQHEISDKIFSSGVRCFNTVVSVYKIPSLPLGWSPSYLKALALIEVLVTANGKYIAGDVHALYGVPTRCQVFVLSLGDGEHDTFSMREGVSEGTVNGQIIPDSAGACLPGLLDPSFCGLPLLPLHPTLRKSG